MTQEPRREPGEVLPPHPTLGEYYGRDEEKPGFVRHLFDSSAASYDRIERMIGLGTGPWYRRQALMRAGLKPGMRLLDVAIGTGLVAREAVRLAGATAAVIGLDPSAGMLAEARRQLGVCGILGFGESIPLREASFDVVSMGYALRHLSDLTTTFREFFRVLRPGGTVCLLELTRPSNRAGYACLRFYLQRVVPMLTRLATANPDAELLMRYFWDTIEGCVPPERILTALDEAGFVDVKRALVLGLFSEYTGRKPGPDVARRSAPLARDEGNFFVRTLARPAGA